ncbi:MAG TPA: hotdog fold thioesterase [Candidatus Stackebrandtia excrementipullorum]|nr:hotdog fold thioesterase [Candidatus Stackebrandtia excrementipullorum]
MTHNDTVFPVEIVEQFSEMGVDLAALFSAGKLGERMGIRVAHASPERITATMPVDGNTQPYGLLHGGASAVLAETLGSIGAMLHAGPHRIAVGVDLNVTHHRAAKAGTVTGVATPIHRGRSTATYEIAVTDENDKRICTGRITCLIKDAPQ